MHLGNLLSSALLVFSPWLHSGANVQESLCHSNQLTVSQVAGQAKLTLRGDSLFFELSQSESRLLIFDQNDSAWNLELEGEGILPISEGMQVAVTLSSDPTILAAMQPPITLAEFKELTANDCAVFLSKIIRVVSDCNDPLRW